MEKQYLTIKETATLLGVTTLTLRNWDKKGKLIAHRHPVNNYRVYKRETVDELLKKIDEGPAKPRKLKINLIEES